MMEKLTSPLYCFNCEKEFPPDVEVKLRRLERGNVKMRIQCCNACLEIYTNQGWNLVRVPLAGAT